jgi:hypothetical protein
LFQRQRKAEWSLRLSAAMDLFNRNLHFKLSDSDEGFAQTGLKRTSFVAGDRIQEIEATRLIECIGQFEEPMASDFTDWIG